ncbi:MAG: hypothetical protein PHR86_05205, partial [Desulfobacterales bacterium]|nr:hypothetical protein [Desulfobacterales bacterium]
QGADVDLRVPAGHWNWCAKPFLPRRFKNERTFTTKGTKDTKGKNESAFYHEGHEGLRAKAFLPRRARMF